MKHCEKCIEKAKRHKNGVVFSMVAKYQIGGNAFIHFKPPYGFRILCESTGEIPDLYKKNGA